MLVCRDVVLDHLRDSPSLPRYSLSVLPVAVFTTSVIICSCVKSIPINSLAPFPREDKIIYNIR
jgi:hypothetical protein